MFFNASQVMLRSNLERPLRSGVDQREDHRTVMTQPTKLRSFPVTNITKMAATKTISLLLPLMCALTLLPSCSPCSDAFKSKAVSPDGSLVANVYERNCGATTDFSSMVNVQSASDKFHPDEGLLFVAKGRYVLSVSWTGSRTLLVSCTSCSRNNVYREVSILGDIDVKYNLGSGL